MGFFRQEYRSGLLCPSSGDLPNPGIEPASPVSPALVGGFFTTEPPEKPLKSEFFILLSQMKLFQDIKREEEMENVPSLQGPCDRSLKSELPCGSCLNWR